MFKGNLFKINKEKIGKWRSWSKYLLENKTEVLTTLEEEKMIFEGCLEFENNQEEFVILFGYHVEDLLKSTDREINRKHLEMIKECLEFKQHIDTLYFFNSQK